MPLGLVVGLLAAGLVAVGFLVTLIRRRSPPSAERMVLELERAFERCDRPLSPGATLKGLEHSFRSSAAAVRYLRALRLARFAGAPELPSAADRRAVRGELAAGLGAAGRLRALWALPPRVGHRRRSRGG